MFLSESICGSFVNFPFDALFVCGNSLDEENSCVEEEAILRLLQILIFALLWTVFEKEASRRS